MPVGNPPLEVSSLRHPLHKEAGTTADKPSPQRTHSPLVAPRRTPQVTRLLAAGGTARFNQPPPKGHPILTLGASSLLSPQMTSPLDLSHPKALDAGGVRLPSLRQRRSKRTTLASSQV